MKAKLALDALNTSLLRISQAKNRKDVAALKASIASIKVFKGMALLI
ncbi:hypothetical protein [Brasilonema sp. UFV-L1]